MKKKESKSLALIVSCDCFDFDLGFSFGETNPELRERLERVLNDPDSDFSGLNIDLIMKDAELNCRGKFIKHDNLMFIRMSVIPKTPDEIGLLAHEIYHATHGIMEYIGVRYSSNSSEAFAYLMEYITKTILTKINIP